MQSECIVQRSLTFTLLGMHEYLSTEQQFIWNDSYGMKTYYQQILQITMHTCRRLNTGTISSNIIHVDVFLT